MFIKDTFNKLIDSLELNKEKQIISDDFEIKIGLNEIGGGFIFIDKRIPLDTYYSVIINKEIVDFHYKNEPIKFFIEHNKFNITTKETVDVLDYEKVVSGRRPIYAPFFVGSTNTYDYVPTKYQVNPSQTYEENDIRSTLFRLKSLGDDFLIQVRNKIYLSSLFIEYYNTLEL